MNDDCEVNESTAFWLMTIALRFALTVGVITSDGQSID